MPDKKTYSVNQICEVFYVTPVTVYRWVREGAPIDKIGTRRVCKDIDKLIEWHKNHYGE